MLQKQTLTFNFASGVDTLTDPYQLPLGKFYSLSNSVFIQNEGQGKLEKRSGFNPISSFTGYSYLTTFRGNLLGVGNSVIAYSNSVSATIGYFQPLQLSVVPLNRNFYSPSTVDSARATNGFVCYAYSAPNPLTAPALSYYVSVVDGSSGQSILSPAQITDSKLISSVFGSESKPPRVFSLNNRFLVAFDGISSSSAALQYFTIDQATLSVSSVSVISLNYLVSSSASMQQSFDGAVANNTLYLAWSGSSSQILATTISSAYQQGSIAIIASNSCDMMSVCVDTSTATTFFATYVPTYNTQTAKIVATDSSFNTRFSTKTVTSSAGSGIVNVTCASLGGVCNSYLEKGLQYTYAPGIPDNRINTFSTTVAGSVSSEVAAVRGVGLASRAFIMASQSCFMSMYSSPYQSTYFLHAATYIQNFVVPSTLKATVNVIGKLAYGNAPNQYLLPSTPNYVLSLPSATVTGSSAQLAYLVNTTITPLNKVTNVSSVTPITAVYSAQGINLSNWTFGTNNFQAAEIESNLHLNGGYLWMYDGTSPVEHNFLVYPDNMTITTGTTGGSLSTQTYYYQAIWQWQDSQGNIHRSAPSVPIGITTSGSASSNLLNIPVPRLTQRNTTNPIVLSVFRWSTGQQIYFKIAPSTVMDSSALSNDSVPIFDGKSDPQIIGNEIIYTNGGVLEDVGSPACTGLALFDSRLWLVDAEDENLLWFGKPGVESAPVEMSDLQTYFVPPNVSGVPISGGVKCIFSMDDKLILFKRGAILYINGVGPDSTGANNQYSSPILVTSGVGCTNPNSLVLVPSGIMFQSDKGIWLLGRDLSINYIGKEVEDFNACPVMSALNIPGTNEARFTLGSSGLTLVYDYFAGQWDYLGGIPGVSSVIYKNQHTYISPTGLVSQQLPGSFIDNGVPTTMGWTTGWISPSGVQGYTRSYKAYLLGQFFTPHTYTVGIAYNYNPQITQTVVINPTNTVSSGSIVEQWQINFQTQQCQSFQLTFTETASSTAGAGLSLSGIKLVVGLDKDYPRNIGATNKIG